MLKVSMDNAQQDMIARSLREEQVEADRVVEALNSALAKDGKQLLEEKELEEIISQRDVLIAARYNADNAEQIKQAIKNIEAASEEYVARRMNNSVRSMMKGHKLEEFEK